MKYEWLDEYLMSKRGVEKDYKIEWEWHRYMLRGKLFAAIMHTEEKYQPPYGGHEMMNLKCDPRLAEAYRETYPEVHPGFYTDKTHWNAVFLDGELPDELLKEMCDMSYRLIFEKLTKKAQKEISGG